jgi:hypothetical protein
MIIFVSVRFLSKKVTKPNFFFFLKKKPKPNRNRVKPTGFGSVRFGFFRAKTGSNRFGSVFSVLARFFPVLARFFRFGSVLARFFFRFFVGFGSVRFFCYKTETEPAGFFKKLIGFFFRFGFFSFFFPVFSV